MSESNDRPSTDPARELTWLLDAFKDNVSGAESVLLVSAEGLPQHTSTGLKRDDAEHLAAITSSAHALMRSADTHFGGPGNVKQFVGELESRRYFVTRAAENTLLAVITDPEADAGGVGHAMALLVTQTASHLATESRTPHTAA